MRVLIDADVILDLLLERQPHFPATVRLFNLLQAGLVRGYLTSLSYANLFYVLRKALRSGPSAVAALRKLRLLTNVLPVDEKVIDLALASDFSDFEDAIQYYAALEKALDALVTRNRDDYQSSRIPVMSVEECVTAARTQGGVRSDN
jgi:predicted nucleic acid-binding protein